MQHIKPKHQGIFLTSQNRYRVTVYNKHHTSNKSVPRNVYVGTFDTIDEALTAKQDKIEQLSQETK